MEKMRCVTRGKGMIVRAQAAEYIRLYDELCQHGEIRYYKKIILLITIARP